MAGSVQRHQRARPRRQAGRRRARLRQARGLSDPSAISARSPARYANRIAEAYLHARRGASSSWPPTTDRMRCTAASKASISRYGRPGVSGSAASVYELRYASPTARRLSGHVGCHGHLHATRNEPRSTGDDSRPSSPATSLPIDRRGSGSILGRAHAERSTSTSVQRPERRDRQVTADEAVRPRRIHRSRPQRRSAAGLATATPHLELAGQIGRVRCRARRAGSRRRSDHGDRSIEPASSRFERHRRLLSDDQRHDVALTVRACRCPRTDGSSVISDSPSAPSRHWTIRAQACATGPRRRTQRCRLQTDARAGMRRRRR